MAHELWVPVVVAFAHRFVRVTVIGNHDMQFVNDDASFVECCGLVFVVVVVRCLLHDGLQEVPSDLCGHASAHNFAVGVSLLHGVEDLLHIPVEVPV